MQNNVKTFSLSVLAALVITACGSAGSDGNGGPHLLVDANGVSTFSNTALSGSLAALPNETLNLTEQESMAYMREEEKLAHDVYIYLDRLWGNNIQSFGNIANSEATHTEAIRQLLLRYALTDPAATSVPGSFANATLQSLYSQLVASGTPTLVDALKVGVAIEELDIVDLKTALVNIDNQDIRLVYENLLKGSRNHLRAFVKSLTQQGVAYVPQYLSPADFDAIVSTPIERN